MQNIIDSTAQYLLSQQVISKKDVKIYRYGLEMLFLSLVEILSILGLSLFIGNFFETVLFFLAFIPLRLFAGGYHATTRLRCYLVSLCVYGIFSLCLIIVPTDLALIRSVSSALISFLIVMVWAPVIHKNRHLEKQTYIYCKRVSRKIAMVWLVTIVICGGLFLGVWIMALALGYFAEAASVLVVKINRR